VARATIVALLVHRFSAGRAGANVSFCDHGHWDPFVGVERDECAPRERFNRHRIRRICRCRAYVRSLALSRASPVKGLESLRYSLRVLRPNNSLTILFLNLEPVSELTQCSIAEATPEAVKAIEIRLGRNPQGSVAAPPAISVRGYCFLSSQRTWLPFSISVKTFAAAFRSCSNVACRSFYPNAPLLRWLPHSARISASTQSHLSTIPSRFPPASFRQLGATLPHRLFCLRIRT